MIWGLFAAFIASHCIGIASAQDVSLTSRDGSLTIEGTLLGYDGEFYRVDTIYGILTFNGQAVDCAGPACPELGAFVPEIVISGSRRMADVLVPALLQRFADARGFEILRIVEDDTRSFFEFRKGGTLRAKFELKGTSTSEGFADLIADVADIALVLREPRANERLMADLAGYRNLVKGRRARLIALDGIVAVAGQDVPIRSLSIDQMAALFSGSIKNWKDLGGQDAPVELFLPDATSGFAQAFEDIVLSSRELSFPQTQNSYSSLSDLTDDVAETSLGVGLTTLSEIGNADMLQIAGSCGVTQSANSRTLRTEDYPLTLPMMFFTPARRLPLVAREFLDFTESTAADNVIRRLGLVDQSVTVSEFSAQGGRLAHAINNAGDEIGLEDLKELVGALGQRDRLSTTFRFSEGGIDLDLRSREHVARLARALEAGEFDGRDLLLAGFSDGFGPATANLALSNRRAQVVLEEIRFAAETADLDRLNLSTKAFGESLPVACDDTEAGRNLNRRVEVWIK